MRIGRRSNHGMRCETNIPATGGFHRCNPTHVPRLLMSSPRAQPWWCILIGEIGCMIPQSYVPVYTLLGAEQLFSICFPVSPRSHQSECESGHGAGGARTWHSDSARTMTSNRWRADDAPMGRSAIAHGGLARTHARPHLTREHRVDKHTVLVLNPIAYHSAKHYFRAEKALYKHGWIQTFDNGTIGKTAYACMRSHFICDRLSPS